ncbi:MAG: YcxB family protein [Firmicutes bacterium]|nr:YcxB family protein [Bacillota bacterium]
MINCRTTINKKLIKSLTKYHMSFQKKSASKKLFTLILCIIVTTLASLNTYGYFLKYMETESFLKIILRSSVFIIFGSILLYTNIKGAEIKLYRKLAEYFKAAEIEYMDYTISERGINLSIKNKLTPYPWSTIEKIKTDNSFIYFTSEGKHSIISKKEMSAEDLASVENIIKTYK